jgi:hypothetical protein
VLDSTLEIAFKDYLVNESGTVYNDARLLSIFSNRSSVHAEVKKYVTIDPDAWKRLSTITKSVASSFTNERQLESATFK